MISLFNLLFLLESGVAPLKVHKVVVAACSPILEAMLCRDMRGSVEGFIILQNIEDVDWKDHHIGREAK